MAAAATVPSSVLDTGLVRPHERFSLWRETLAPTHEAVLPEGSEPGRFEAWARSRHLGKALLLESRAMPQRLVRSPRTVRADQLDHYIVRLQKSGSWTGEVGGRTVTANPGSVMVLDLARAADARTGDIENVNLVLPRDALDDLLPPFDMHGLVLRNGMAGLLRGHLTELAALPELQAADVQRVAGATLGLVAACLAPSRDAVARARAPIEAAVIAEVRRYIDRHLHAPDLTPRRVSAALGLPRSTLYAVCEPMGGVAAFIQKRRLRRIHAILADARDRRPVAEIAYQHGFASSAHFSRAFRRAFGCSPARGARGRRRSPGRRRRYGLHRRHVQGLGARPRRLAGRPLAKLDAGASPWILGQLLSRIRPLSCSVRGSPLSRRWGGRRAALAGEGPSDGAEPARRHS